jgi:hypothetical protein
MNIRVKDYDSREIFQFNGNGGAGDHFKKAGVIPEEHPGWMWKREISHMCVAIPAKSRYGKRLV